MDEAVAALSERGGTLATVEMFTGGGIAARKAPRPGGENIFRRGVIARTSGDVCAAAWPARSLGTSRSAP